MLSLLLCAALAAADGGVSLRVRALAGESAAPATTEVRLFAVRPEDSIRLCGTSEYRAAPLRTPDAEGWVDFGARAPGEYEVELYDPGWGRARGVFTVPGDAPVVRFTRGGELNVRVVSADGVPIHGAEVNVVPDTFEQRDGLVIAGGNDGAQYEGIRTALTDAAGVVAFHGLPPRHYAVLAHYRDRVQSQGVAADAGAHVEVRLAPGFRISGQVLGSDGGALVNPWVMVDAVNRPQRAAEVKRSWARLLEPVPAQPVLDWYGAGYPTDAGTTFTVETHLPGRVRVSARIDGCEETPALEVQPPVDDVVLRGGPRALVKGRVRGAGQASLEDVELSFLCGEDVCYSQALSSPAFAVEVPLRCKGLYVERGASDLRRTFKLRAGQVLDLGELVLPAKKKR